MMNQERSTRWTWAGTALLPLLLMALLVGAGLRGASAQDATPDAEPQDTPPALGEEAGRPAHIHSGTCEGGGVGPVVQTLNALTAPAGDEEGQENAAVVESSFTSVPLALDDILAVDHVVNVHFSFEEFDFYIACGEIGGAVDEAGSLAVGLREANESGFSGVAFLSPDPANPAATNVSVFLAEGLNEGQETSAAASPVAVQGTEVAEATEEADGGDADEGDADATPAT